MRFPFEIQKERRFDVFCFGTNAVDYLITVPKFPVYASKIDLRSYLQAAGGEAASTAVGLRRLGLKIGYGGSFGDDDAGIFGIRSLEIEGVDVNYCKRVPGAPTQIAFIIIDEMSGERTVIWKRDQALAFASNEAPVIAAAESTFVHMTPHDTDACIKIASAARESGTAVSLDVDDTFPDLEKLLPMVDILICSSEFPAQLTGIQDKKDALSEINRRFSNILCGMTLGAAGSLLYSSGVFIETPGFDVPGGCRDTTGAGDAFRTGLLYALLKGESVEQAARVANAVAALKCRSVGARTALPDNLELNALLKNS